MNNMVGSGIGPNEPYGGGVGVGGNYAGPGGPQGINVNANNPQQQILAQQMADQHGGVPPNMTAMEQGNRGPGGVPLGLGGGGVGNDVSGAGLISGPQQQMNSAQMNPNQGPGTSQQGSSAGAASSGGSGTGSSGNQHITDERKKQQQLMLLIHAHRCNRSDSIKPNREICIVPDCKPVQDVLTHMATCKQSRDCTVQHCISFRQILLHYKTCSRSDCVICFPFRHAYLNNNPNGLGGGGVGNDVSGAGLISSPQQQMNSAQMNPNQQQNPQGGLMGPGGMGIRPPQGGVGPVGHQQSAMMIPQQQQQQQQQGPGTSQQGSSAGAASSGGSGTGSSGNQHITDECKKQQQLMLLLHAHKCNRRDKINPNREKCIVPDCKPVQDVLTHMATCKQIRDCTVQHCTSSRQILLHYKTCLCSDCVICFPFRQSHAYQNNKPNASGAANSVGLF